MSTGERRPELDGVRGVAILLVLVGHSAVPAYGPAGVALFFVLSGYLITGLLLAERERWGRLNLRRFYARRFTRLAPPLFVMLAVTGVLLRPGWGPFLAAATWTGNYASLGTNLGPYNHTWSLAVEEQFYLVFPLLFGLLIARRNRVRVLAGVVVGLMACRLVVLSAGGYAYAYAALEMAGSAILAGCLLALARWQLRGAWAVVGLATLLVIGVAATMYGVAAAFPYVQLAATPAAAVMVAAAPSCRWLAWRPLTFCGVASYSLYLWHYPVAYALGAFTPFGVALGAAVGLIAYVGVESPLMRWRARSAGGQVRAWIADPSHQPSTVAG